MWLKNSQFVYRMVGDLPIVEVRRKEGLVRRIYIEGDGKAYRTAYEPSGDPTPVNPVGLRLFLADADEGAVYLGRLCQWRRTAVCRDAGIWTEKRFGLGVVDLYVREVKELSKGEPVELVGYSGGAFLALQVAARLPNVMLVRTVAGNVDPEEVNRLHQASAIEVADWPVGGRIHEVPQVHFVGARDTVVTPEVAEHFMQRVRPVCANVVQVEATHSDGWVEKWPALLHEKAPCAMGEGPR